MTLTNPDSSPMQTMLLKMLFSQWLGLAENKDYESTEQLIRDLKAAVAVLDSVGDRQ